MVNSVPVSIRIHSISRDKFRALEQSVESGQYDFVKISFAGKFSRDGGEISPLDLTVSTGYQPKQGANFEPVTLEMLGEVLKPTGFFPRATPVEPTEVQQEFILRQLMLIEQSAQTIVKTGGPVFERNCANGIIEVVEFTRDFLNKK